MSLGIFGNVWEALTRTQHSTIGKVSLSSFIATFNEVLCRPRKILNVLKAYMIVYRTMYCKSQAFQGAWERLQRRSMLGAGFVEAQRRAL